MLKLSDLYAAAEKLKKELEADLEYELSLLLEYPPEVEVYRYNLESSDYPTDKFYFNLLDDRGFIFNFAIEGIASRTTYILAKMLHEFILGVGHLEVREIPALFGEILEKYEGLPISLEDVYKSSH